ncbi:helix-turn-helix domain-containing protein [Aneurinibacillus aneurinilyticus]|uniref:helix-turn-helix domain-containing protein n=1 Tax=Aneurinibacillus aneurinilyticus TaxID=1391 RepID=UPI0023F45277|nr:helix-turn-helix transcriptional regulator [Aneurinibacillus aneurinilyticus]
MSRATLTTVYYSRGKGIQFDTMDALCEMFGVGVGELLVHTKEETSEEIYRNDTHRC